MEHVTECKWENIVRNASEMGFFGYSVRPMALQENVWVSGMALYSTSC